MFSTWLARAANPKARPRAEPTDWSVVAAWQNAQFANWPGYDDWGVFAATEQEVIGLPVIAGFIDITTALVLQMPLHAYQLDTRLEDVPNILVSPVPNATFAEWITSYLREMVLHGNYVAVLGPSGPDGFPEFMYPVPFEQWSIVTTGTDYYYQVNDKKYLPGDVFHVRRNVCTGDLIGKGVLQLFSHLVGACVAAEKWASSYFDGGAVPPAHIEHPNPDLTADMALQLKAKWRDAVRKHEAVVTPQGTVVHALSSNAEDAQLEQTRRTNEQMLARAVGIPGALLSLDAPSLTYRNITDVLQQFITTTVMGYLVPLEQQVSLQCLPEGQRAAFSTSAVLRPDLEARVRLAVESIQAGLFTVDEARVYFDLAGSTVPVLSGSASLGVAA